MVDCIKKIQMCSLNFSFKSDQIYRKDAQCSETHFSVLEVFFVRLLVFEIWSILMYVTSCIQKTEELFAKYAVDANQ